MAPQDLPSIAAMVRERVADDGVGLLFEDQRLSYRELVAGAAARAALFDSLRQPGPPHIGLLLENVPDFAMWLCAAGVSGTAIVGINPTRRGEGLARDIRHTDCQMLVTEKKWLPLLDEIESPVATERTFVVDDPAYQTALAPHLGATLPDVAVDPLGLFMLFFTSGTTGAPKAVICSQVRLAMAGMALAARNELAPGDVCYQAMPMFHSNAMMAGFAPCLAAGATHALRRKFSASGFLPDVRRFGASYFNYVGKPLAYELATPEASDDADNPLRNVFGNEATERDQQAFAKRFGVPVVDGYGSSEGGANLGRTPDTPRGSLGPAGENIVVLDAETGSECPRAKFDEQGRLLNADEAIGEMVNKQGAAVFEGYYNNDEANSKRIRDGMYWTGDLAYRDENGFIYFAGRDLDWLRVDGENFASAPVERILERFPGVTIAAVYAVPDAIVGDQVMAALQLEPSHPFDAAAFASFLSEQRDLGTKWAPLYVRLSETLPVTQTNKVLKRGLRSEHWECSEPVFLRDAETGFRELTAADREEIRADFRAHEREEQLDR